MSVEAGKAYVTVTFDKAAAEKTKASMVGFLKGAAALFAAQKVFDFGKEAIQNAAQTQKATESVRANFGKAGKEINDFNEKVAAGFGISNEAGSQFASQMGVVTTNLHLGQKQGAGMTLGLEKLAGSFALIKGTDPGPILAKLQKAILGNTRGLKDMGIAITPVAEKQAALALGIQGSSKSWNSAEKAQIIYSIAMSKLPALMDQAKKHSGDLADQQIKLRAEFSNIQEEIGSALLPVVTALASALQRHIGLVKTLIPYVTAFVAVLAALYTITKAVAVVQAALDVVLAANPIGIVVIAIAALVAGMLYLYRTNKTVHDALNRWWADLRALAERYFPVIRTYAVKTFQDIKAVVFAVWPAIKAYVHTYLQLIADYIRLISDVIHGRWGDAWQQIKNIVHDALSGIVQIVKNLGPLIIRGIEWVGAHLGGAAANLGENIIKGILNGLKNLAGQIGSYLLTLAENAVKNAVSAVLGGSSVNPNTYGGRYGVNPHLTHHAVGGLVTAGVPSLVGERGPEIFQPLSNGRIIPNNQLGGGNITVHSVINLDGRKIADVVSKHLARDLHAGTVWGAAT